MTDGSVRLKQTPARSVSIESKPTLHVLAFPHSGARPRWKNRCGVATIFRLAH
jgi:hypothetical protein